MKPSSSAPAVGILPTAITAAIAMEISLFFIFIPLILFRVNVNSLYPIHVLNAMRIVNSRKLWYNQVIMVSIIIQNIKGKKKYEQA